MSDKMQNRVSKLFHRPSTNSSEKEERKGSGSGHVVTPTATLPRTRPTFSLSSLSFRRQSVTSSSSVLTPPLTPPPTSITASSSASSGSEVALHIRNPPPSLHDHERDSFDSSNSPQVSYFDFSASHYSHLHQQLAVERSHAHSAPPSPLSASFPLPPHVRARPHLFEAAPREFNSASSSASQLSHGVIENEPRSRFSDWGTSVGGEGDSRNISSENLSQGDEEGSATPESSSAIEGQEGPGGERDRVDPAHYFSSTSFRSPPPPVNSAHAFDPDRRCSIDVSPRTQTQQRPKGFQPRPHLLVSHHHRPSLVPRDSTVADSSYPELAIAFFMSLKKFKGRKLDRRASTGSLGGAV
ncbi:uncharacterized protein JCM6883_000658 [Sporobolomyces salmoneus]|uniref:uncharacterized protein n=1 Tax=Sporobolomyces salmoneus TaxID=183962 RepID=UPI00317A7487